MTIFIIGISHRTASLALRESLAFTELRIQQLLEELQNYARIAGGVLLSTCNRTEIIVQAKSFNAVVHWIQKQQILIKSLAQYAYVYKDRQAIFHLMRVAGGLDSIAVGEVEVLGQLKSAYNMAKQYGCITLDLGRLFDCVFVAAKQIRSKTNIGGKPISLAYLATKLPNSVFASVAEKQVLVVGCGETAQSILKYLLSTPIKNIVIANRNVDKVQQVISKLSISHDKCLKCISLNNLAGFLSDIDIVFSAIFTDHPVITKQMLELNVQVSLPRQRLLVDLSVPRSISKDCAAIDNLQLYYVDDLQKTCENNVLMRKQAITAAEQIIMQQIDTYYNDIAMRYNLESLKNFRQYCDDLKRQAVTEALQKLKLGYSAEKVVSELGEKLVNRILHQPTLKLRQWAQDNQKGKLDCLQELFAENIASNIIEN